MENLLPTHIDLLESSPCIAQSEGEIKQAIYKSAYIKTLQKGQFLFRRGDEAKGLLGIVNGRFKVSALNSDGKPLTLGYLQSKDWFGEIALVDGIARTHDCEALEASEILVIPKAAFEEYIVSDAKLLRLVTKQICLRMREMMNLVEQATIQSLQERLANRLLSLREPSDNTIYANQQDLAYMMGVSRQSVSKVLLRWAELGWIKIEYNHITLLNLERLLSLCITPMVPQI